MQLNQPSTVFVLYKKGYISPDIENSIVQFNMQFFPIVGDFYFNIHVADSLPFLYSLMSSLCVFKLCFHYFETFNKSHVAGTTKDNAPGGKGTFAVIFVLNISFLLYVMYNSGNGLPYQRYDSLFASEFGAMTFGFWYLTSYMPRLFHYCLNAYSEMTKIQVQLIKESNPKT